MSTDTTAPKSALSKQKEFVIDAKADALAVEKLVTARIGLLLKHGFFGNMASRLKLINADEWLTTAATDGRNFYYCSKFINTLSTKELEFLFGHEVLHSIYDHMGRKEFRDARLFNIAADYCVNADLIKYKIGEKITKVPILFDSKYADWSAEQVYEDLYKNAEKIDISQLLDQLLDEHLEDNDDGEGKDGDNDGTGKGRPRLTAEEKEQIKEEIRSAVLQAAQAAGASNLPGGIKRMVQSLTEPKMNWRELIRQHIESMFKSDFSWLRPSRRSWHMDAILPGMIPGTKVELMVFIDTSGSIGAKQLKDFLSEISGIMSQFEEYKVHVACFDTAVHNPQIFTSENMEDISAYEPGGGGGTDFDSMYNWMKNNDIQPARMVVFTDMCPFGSWGDENYTDVIWISHGGGNTEAPFGITVKYEDAA
jgi:predicted metal-dependent peptidase